MNALASLHANRVLCEPLTAFLPVLQLRDQPAAMARLVVTLRALRTAVIKLRSHYKGITPDQASSLVAAPGFSRDPVIALPYPLRQTARFSEVKQLCDNKLLYAARDNARDDSCASSFPGVDMGARCMQLGQRRVTPQRSTRRLCCQAALLWS